MTSWRIASRMSAIQSMPFRTAAWIRSAISGVIRVLAQDRSKSASGWLLASRDRTSDSGMNFLGSASQQLTQKKRNVIEIAPRFKAITRRLPRQLRQDMEVVLAGAPFREQHVGHQFQQGFVRPDRSQNASSGCGNLRKYNCSRAGLANQFHAVDFVSPDRLFRPPDSLGGVPEEMQLGEKVNRLIGYIDVLREAEDLQSPGTPLQEHHVVAQITEPAPQQCYCQRGLARGARAWNEDGFAGLAESCGVQSVAAASFQHLSQQKREHEVRGHKQVHAFRLDNGEGSATYAGFGECSHPVSEAQIELILRFKIAGFSRRQFIKG